MNGVSDTAGSAPAVRRRVTICNQKGLHARAAAKFVKLAESFDAQVAVEKNETRVPGTSIMGLMMLAASPGCFILGTAGREQRSRQREHNQGTAHADLGGGDS